MVKNKMKENNCDKMEINKIHCIDAKEGIKEIEDGSIGLVITDPPYGIEKEGIRDTRELWGYTLEYFRILRDNTWLCTYVSIQNSYEVMKLMELQGFKYEWQHITYINNRMGRGRLGFNRYLLCLIFRKGNPKIYDKIADVYECSTSSKQRQQNIHPTPKKVKGVKNIIKCLSREDDLVFDPFMGSGTTAIACIELGRNYLGFEIEPKYIEFARKRIENVPQKLFKWIK